MSILKAMGYTLMIILGLGILAGISLAAKVIGFILGWFLLILMTVIVVYYGIKELGKKPGS